MIEVIARGATPASGLPSALETAYREAADDLVQMIAAGEFPFAGRAVRLADSLRVGDGFDPTGGDGVVSTPAPTRCSAYRRLGLVGDLDGADLSG